MIFNRACEQLTGYTREEVIGGPFLQTFVPESWHGTVAARFRDVPIEQLARPHENPWLTKSASERLIEWRCFHVLQKKHLEPAAILAELVASTRSLAAPKQIRLEHLSRMFEPLW